MPAKKRLLAVLAHPDDESFGPGGTLAKYARQGVDVHIAIATDGVAGSVVDEFADRRDDLAAVRKVELVGAVKVLGAQLHMLGYRDSGYIGDVANEHPEAFVQIDLEASAGRIVELMREIRPQVVLTHDEIGGYYHPDHIRCYEITTRAFDVAGDASQYPDIGGEPYQPQKLYYTVFPNRYLKLFTLSMRLRRQDPTRAGRNKDIDLTQLGRPMSEISTHIAVRDTWEVKREASAHHRSQGGGGGFGRRIPQWLQRRVFATEHFIRAQPPLNDHEREKDLFAGL